MKKKLNWIYQNKESGEYFKSVKKDGKIVLSNPSYPFVFLFEVQEPLKEIGSVKEFGKLVEKKNYEFHSGNTLEVEVDNNGDLKVRKGGNSSQD